MGVKFLANPPRVSVYQSTGTSISNTFTALGFNAEQYNVGSLHSNSTNNTRLIATVAGLYFVSFCIAYPTTGAATTTLRGAQIRKNAAGNPAGGTFVANGGWVHAETNNTVPVVGSLDVQLSEGDYIELFGITGNSPQTSVTGVGNTFFQMRWVATT